MDNIEIARIAGQILADKGPTRRLRDADILVAVINGCKVRVFWPDAAEDCFDSSIVVDEIA
jgi:hypothetical protein